MKYVLHGVNPTTFNAVASILAELLMLAAGFCLEKLCSLLVSLWLRRGHKMPAQALGRLPADLLEAVKVAQASAWALPTRVILFLFLADYATTIAFVGLGFELVPEPGAEAPVLSLKRRNPEFPYPIVGDPVNGFTQSKLEVLLLQQQQPEHLARTNHQRDEIKFLARQDAVVARFTGAADAVARGESPFLLHNQDNNQNDPTFLILGREYSAEDSLPSSSRHWLYQAQATVLQAETNDDDSFLTGLPTSIPLDCATESPAWLEIQQTFGSTSILEFQADAYVPDCSFAATRLSGIYSQLDTVENSNHNDETNTVKITAVVSSQASESTFLYMQGQQNKSAETVFQESLNLGTGTSLFAFEFPPNGFAMARDRVEWRRGRQVFGFGGVNLGGRDVPFGVAAVSAGKVVSKPSASSIGLGLVEEKEYKLVAQVLECPPNPNGSSDHGDEQCLAVSKLICEFPEGGIDPMQSRFHSRTYLCRFDSVQIIWGNNFVVDDQLVTAVAGVYSRNDEWVQSSRQERTLAMHSISAAVFSLGVLEYQPSIQQVKSTTINGVFIAFMACPVGICLLAGFLFVCGRAYVLDKLPSDGWMMLLLGLEAEQNPPDEAVNLRYPSVHKGSPIYIVAENASTPSTSSRQSLDYRVRVSIQDEEDVNATGGDQGFDDEAENGTTKGQSELSHNSTRESTRSVVGSMLFSAALLVLGGAFVASKSNESFPHVSVLGALKEDDSDSLTTENIPLGCFRNKFELGTAVYKFLDGTREEQASVATQFGNMSEWCTDYVDDFSYLFMYRGAFAHDISSWNVSRGRSFAFTFAGCDFCGSTYQIDISEWNVSRATSMRGAFSHARQFNSELDQWDVSRVEDFAYCFKNTILFNQPIGTWDVSSGTDFEYMFSETKSFSQNLTNWNFARAESLYRLFYLADAFNGDVSGFQVGNVKDFREVFAIVDAFNSPVGDWDVSRGESFAGMFRFATVFNQDVSQWNVSSGKDFSFMFLEAIAFNSHVSDWDVSHAQNLKGMFEDASVFQSNLSEWDTRNVVDMSWMFSACEEFNGDISGWDVSSVESFDNMFFEAPKFNIDLSSWNVERGKSFTQMFSKALSFDQDMCPWTTKLNWNDTDARSMFAGSSCPFAYEDVSSGGYMCEYCVPTPAPSTIPSQSPTQSHHPSASIAPTANSAMLTIIFNEATWPFENAFNLTNVDKGEQMHSFGNLFGPLTHHVPLLRGKYRFDLLDTFGDGFTTVDDFLELLLDNAIILRVEDFESFFSFEFDVPLPQDFSWVCEGCS